MSISESIFLGLLQGSTEFLPVSSSGHLLVGRIFLELRDIPRLYDVLLHLATLVAVLWVFYRPFLQYAKWVFSASEKGNRILRNVLLALIPTALMGFTIYRWLPVPGPGITGAAFIFTALLLLLSGKRAGGKKIWEMRGAVALAIGIAQGIAVIPGISRAGATLAIALLLGMNRSDAADFSFLIMVPAILGALFLTLLEGVSDEVSAWVLLGGMLSAMIIGVICLKFLLRLLKRQRLDLFSWYLIPLGLGLIIWSTLSLS